MNNNLPPRLAIVIPCYNEEEVLDETSGRIKLLLAGLSSSGKIAEDSYMLLVDDGSRDRTWELIEALNKSDNRIRGLKLSRNFGHQNALLAGLMHADDADIIVCIDADLQDDPNAITAMIDKYHDGYDVVYGVRDSRQTDSWAKRNTALGFYKMLSIFGVQSVYNHADYRLMSRRVMDALKGFEEVNLYLRGMIPLVGFKHTSVFYDRGARFAGESKYNFRKMFSFAWDGLTSLSVKPLHFVTLLGIAVFFLSVVMTIYALISAVFYNTVSGWASTVIPIYFLGGIQLLCVGLIGEYVGKIYKEVKQRP